MLYNYLMLLTGIALIFNDYFIQWTLNTYIIIRHNVSRLAREALISNNNFICRTIYTGITIGYLIFATSFAYILYRYQIYLTLNTFTIIGHIVRWTKLTRIIHWYRSFITPWTFVIHNDFYGRTSCTIILIHNFIRFTLNALFLDDHFIISAPLTFPIDHNLIKLTCPT